LKRAREEGLTQVFVDRFKEVNFGSRRVLEKNGFRHLGDAGILLNGEVRKEWEYEIQL
jgi:RimJ/RimL family protein N-acetyltransferase